jgi:hypothetical protein
MPAHEQAKVAKRAHGAKGVDNFPSLREWPEGVSAGFAGL